MSRPLAPAPKQRHKLTAIHADAPSRMPSHGAGRVSRTLRAQVTARLCPSWAALSLPCTGSHRLIVSRTAPLALTSPHAHERSHHLAHPVITPSVPKPSPPPLLHLAHLGNGMQPSGRLKCLGAAS
ncbi:hypothetical protein DENSPDRAFT_886005 [Dentipellis sp. KUC8613]|nr:hypothetical protein DENSPDRAFT_886005 [Dentipellis sp. KUC8613]